MLMVMILMMMMVMLMVIVMLSVFDTSLILTHRHILGRVFHYWLVMRGRGIH